MKFMLVAKAGNYIDLLESDALLQMGVALTKCKEDMEC